MKRTMIAALAALVAITAFTSCFKEPETEGFLSGNIYLKGADTMYVSIGSKVQTDVAFLDESTRPCRFRIENVRKANTDERKEDFFVTYPTRLWVTPYDYLTDTTSQLVLGKLSDAMLTPLMINEVNGQLRTMESTSKMDVKPGDVYNIDVSVTNSKGTRLLENYATLKFESGSEYRPYVLTEVINGICVTVGADTPDPASADGAFYPEGTNVFPYYDIINSSQADFAERQANIYADNGKEPSCRIRKLSDEPTIGIEVRFRLMDENGNLFDPADYATYSSGTTSYIDYSVDRENTTDGMVLRFPVTPWPVKTDLMSYLKGKSYTSFSNLDVANLKADNLAGRIPYNARWPQNDYAGFKAWYVRIRSVVTFYESGTWEFTCTVPYAAAR